VVCCTLGPSLWIYFTGFSFLDLLWRKYWSFSFHQECKHHIAPQCVCHTGLVSSFHPRLCSAILVTLMNIVIYHAYVLLSVYIYIIYVNTIHQMSLTLSLNMQAIHVIFESTKVGATSLFTRTLYLCLPSNFCG